MATIFSAAEVPSIVQDFMRPILEAEAHCGWLMNKAVAVCGHLVWSSCKSCQCVIGVCGSRGEADLYKALTCSECLMQVQEWKTSVENVLAQALYHVTCVVELACGEP